LAQARWQNSVQSGDPPTEENAMPAERQEAAGPSVLLVAELELREREVARALEARGVRVRSVASAMAALRLLRTEGADVVVLGLPLAGADPIAVCAALKEAPYAPALLLADASDQAAELSGALPESCRPDGVVPRPLEAAKLAIAIHECLQAQNETGSEGDAIGISLAELLIELKRRRTSEVLELRAAGICTAIHLREGDPIFAEGGSLQETLGRQLVRRGSIGHDDYARVVERMTEGVIHHESLRLGEVLVELGLLSPAEVYDALALQVREKIVACFQWDAFGYELHQLLDEPEDLGIYQCPPMEALVLAGLRAHYGPERLAALLDPLADSVPELRATPDALVPLYQPTPAEQKLLRAIDGTQSVATLRGSGILDPVNAGQLLAALHAGCALAFRRTPLPAPARERMRPPRPAPAAARAHREPARPLAAPAAAAPLAGSAAAAAPPARSSFDPLTQLRRRMRLAPAAGPGAGDPKQARLEAENAFNHGLRLLRESLLPGALREFRRAVERMPEEPEYRLLEAWLEYRGAQGGDARALAAAKVRACAQRVLQASRTSARAHSILGQLALGEADDEAALSHLRLALRYDPADVEAQRGLRLLEKRRGA
jgi:DNA-binding NarL/FixJ family response regulator